MLNVEANRLELLAAAQNAESLTPANSPVDILECALLTVEEGGLTVCAGNLEMGMECRVPVTVRDAGTLAVNARLLSAMLRLLEGETVSLCQEDKNAVTLKGGEAVYTVMTKDPKEYPRMEISLPEQTVTISGLPAMSRRTVFAACEDEAHPLLRCVHLTFSEEGLRAVSSDGFRIAAAKGQGKGEAVELLLPAASLEKLAQLVSNRDELRVGITESATIFQKEGLLFSARRMEGNFLNTDQVLKGVKPAFSLLTDGVALREGLCRVCLENRTHSRFSVNFNGNSIKMTWESQWGTSSTELEALALSGLPAGTFWYNPDKLLGCLKALKGSVILKVCQAGTLVLETDELICLQMAMREPDSTAQKEKNKKKSPPQKEAA